MERLPISVRKKSRKRRFRQKSHSTGSRTLALPALLDVIYVLGIDGGGFVFIRTHDSFGANVAVDVVAVAQRADDHTARSGGMCEFSVADVNSDMGYSGSRCIKEYQVACSQITAGYGRTHAELGTRLMGQIDAQLIKYVHCKSRAVKSACCGSARSVLGSDRAVDHFIHLGICESASCADREHNGETHDCCCKLLLQVKYPFRRLRG